MKTKTTFLSLGITLCFALFTTVLFAQAPPNDDCNGALSLIPGASCVTYTGTDSLATASAVAVCAASAEDDVWFKFQAIYTSHCIKVTGIGIFDPVVEVFAGFCGGISINCTNATGAGSSENVTLSGLTAGNLYWIRIYDAQPFASPTPHFNICITNCGISAPINDDCTGAFAILETTLCTPTSGDVSNSTDSGVPSSNNCNTSNPNDDVWYTFVASTTDVTITLAPSASFDPCFELFSSSCGVSSYFCNATGGQPGAIISSCISGLTIGSTYWLRVYDYGSGYPTTATFNLCVTKCMGVGIQEHETDVSFSVAPNPFNSHTIITFNKEQKNTSVRITDLLGKEIKTINFSGKELNIEKGDVEKGIYFINAGGVNRKIIVN